ncbi:MAG: DinB family protein [Candidatus Sulfotelmatobacter sp.]
MVSAFATAPQTVPATLSPQVREAALKRFETTRNNFLKSLSGLSQKQWTFKPASDRWSVAEVAEPITVSESAIFGLVQKQIMTSPAARGEARSGQRES